MKKADAQQATTSPAQRLTGVLALTGVVLLALFWFTFDSYRNNTTAQLRNLRLAELQGTIAHLDDVLTMSARLAAATGDPA